MLIFATIYLSSLRQVQWLAASADNGYGQYMAAARMIETPPWKDLQTQRKPERSLELCREEAKLAGPILDALKKGNSMPVYDPCKVETLATLHPEYAFFKAVGRIACDVAYSKAIDGDLESASQWLIQADRFAFRLPTPYMITSLVKQAMLHRLRESTEELLPRFVPRQLEQQLAALQEIANKPEDVEAAAQGDLQITNRSIDLIVADPSFLGLKDDPTDFSPFMVDGDEMREFTPEMLSAYAKGLTPESRAHAEKIIKIYVDPPLANLVAAFQRPEKYWWRPWEPQPDPDAFAVVLNDVKEGRFEWVDMFAVQIADVILELSSDGYDDETRLPRYFLLEREKARLAVVDAKIRSYQAIHHRLPIALKEIGSPADPLSNQPYHYVRTTPTAYKLAAIGIPGIGTITESTKPAPASR